MTDLYAQFNKQLYRISAIKVEGQEQITNSDLMFSLGGSSNEDPILLSSGNIAGNLTIIDGTLKSSNFVTGVSGWELTPTTSEFPSITVSGGTIKYQKTSFTDTVNAGYHISSSGFYFGSANDVSYVKYNIGTSDFDIVGAITSSTITSSTITGGTIRTSESNKRIVLSSSDNSLSFYDISNNLILGLGTEASVNLLLEAYTDIIAFQVRNNSAVALTVANLAAFDVTNVASVADSLQLTNTGSGSCLFASNTGIGRGAYISTSSSTNSALKVNQDDLSKAGVLIESVDGSDAIKEMLELNRLSGGAGVSSQGAAIGFYGRDSATNREQIGSLGFGFTNQTNGSEASKALITLRSTDILELRSTGTVVAGNQAVLATNATDGFLYIPTSAGTPTGTPTAFTGKVAMEYDTTNNKLYIYDGGWIGVVLT